MENIKMYKIMIVEDDVNIRMELKMILENALYETLLEEDFKDTALILLKIILILCYLMLIFLTKVDFK